MVIRGGWVFLMSEVPLYNGEVDSPELSLLLFSVPASLFLSRSLFSFSLSISLSLALALSLSLSLSLSVSLSLSLRT